MEENIDGEVVLDASFIVAFLLPDERIDEVDTKFDLYETGKIKFISLYLLPFEVLNSLKNSILRKRITKHTASDLAADFFRLRIAYSEIDFESSLLLSIKENLSFYDSSYVWLAKSKSLPLLSLDKKMTELAAK